MCRFAGKFVAGVLDYKAMVDEWVVQLFAWLFATATGWQSAAFIYNTYTQKKIDCSLPGKIG